MMCRDFDPEHEAVSFYGMSPRLSVRRGPRPRSSPLSPVRASGAPLVKTEHVEARARLRSDAPSQPGKPALVGARRCAWPTSGTPTGRIPAIPGLPTRIQWTLPEGWKAGEIQWPYPQPLPVGPLMNYGYEDEVVLLVELTPPADAPSGTRRHQGARPKWLVCKDICVPEKGELDLALPVVERDTRAGSALAGQLRARAQHASGAGERVEVRGGGDAASRCACASPRPRARRPRRGRPSSPSARTWSSRRRRRSSSREGRVLRIEMKLAQPPLAGVASVSGVAVSQEGWAGTERRKALAFEAPTGASIAPVIAAAAPADAIGGSAIVAFAFALAGGLLLNLMPCVFPVLGIKVMGFVKHAHGEARAMRLQGVVFAAGVVLSFLVLAAIMLALRAGGAQLGWGFQLQSPVVVSLLAALFFLLALNLSGVFEWGAFAQSMTSNLTARGRYADALLAGVLATRGGHAVHGAVHGRGRGLHASRRAPASRCGVFAMLGVGMALPVLLLSLFPRLLRRLPKPGAWMETFKQVLAFPLFADRPRGSRGCSGRRPATTRCWRSCWDS